MKGQRFVPVLVACLLILLSVLIVVSVRNTRGPCGARDSLCVVYLDVGQGDATFIESPVGIQVLIDGGPDTSVLRQLGKTMGYFDRTIDLIVATHPDSDHISGLVDVLKRYRVKTILMTENEHDTPVSDSFVARVNEEGAKIIMARRGQVFDLGFASHGSTTLTVLFPDRDTSGLESNTSSIVSRLDYGETAFLFTGDAPQSIEEYVLALENSHVDYDVLKAGHHGSDTSSSGHFIELISPTYAIISAGKNNRYGHPHRDVLDRFAQFGVITKNTADFGSIFVFSNGEEVQFK